MDPLSLVGDLLGKVFGLFSSPEDKLKAQELQNQISLALTQAQ